MTSDSLKQDSSPSFTANPDCSGTRIRIRILIQVFMTKNWKNLIVEKFKFFFLSKLQLIYS
jgi:hypothetical protein